MGKSFDLTGKRALITGGIHGLGIAMAKGQGYAGAELIVNNLHQKCLKKQRKRTKAKV